MLSFTLRKRLRHFTLDLSLDVGAETLVMIGHSGCGKSTTLRILAGLLSPDSGEIELDGRVLLDTGRGVKGLPPEDRDVGYLVQSYALFPHLSVTDNVAYGISRLDRDEQVRRVEEVLNLVGIRHLAGATPGQLSGGEQQRVALARALARRPKFLLLDEPLSALDVSTRTRVRAELKTILESLAIPSIVVTHDYEDARILGHQIAVMDRGEILQSGTAGEISKRPADAFVAAFTDTNLLPAGDGRSTQIAFDPWRVTVSRSPAGVDYEWRGRVRDISVVGAFTRINLETGEATSILADVPGQEVGESGFDVGDTVFARVSPDDVRPVASAPLPEPDRTEGASGEEEVQPLSIGGRGFLSSTWGLALVAFLVLALGGYAASETLTEDVAGQETMTALVAANMTDAGDALIEDFEEEREGTQVEVSYAGTQVLFSQIEQGVSSDFFLSADLEYIERAEEQGFIDSYSPVSQMDLVIIVPEGNPGGVSDLEDLAIEPVSLVIGVEEVPIGQYTRQVLDNANEGYGPGFSERVVDQVVSNETNTREVSRKVVLRESEVGIVYRTDVTPDIADDVEVIEIPEEYNVTAMNYAAVLNDAENPELAQEFLEMMLSPEGQETMSRFKYEPIE